MDEFCGSKFWDWELTWYTDDPDLTQCFQKTVLVWIPCAFLWIFGACIYVSRPTSKGQIPWSPFNLLKIFLCLVLMLLQVVKLTNEVRLDVHGFTEYFLDLYTPVLELITYGLALAAVVFCRHVGIRSSNVLFGFWFLKTVCEAVPFRSTLRNYSTIHNDADMILYLLEVISYPIIVAQFLLNCWVDSTVASKEYDPKFREDRSCPKNQSSTLNRLLFSWFDPLAWKGYKKPLETTDVWELDPENATSSLVKTFDQHWFSKLRKSVRDINKGKKPKAISVISVLFASFGTEFAFGAVLKLIPDLLAFVSPQVLNLLILFVNGDEETWKGYFYAGLLLVTDIIVMLGRNHFQYYMYITNFRVKSALMSAIYRKALVISNATRKESTVGEIVNLMSVDVTKIMEVLPYLNFLWSSPLQISIALYFLWMILGPSVLAGLGVMILLIPLNAIVTSKVRKYQVAQMQLKDQRVKLMSEVLSGVKILKLYAWEPSFHAEVMKIRDKEVKTLKSAAYLGAFNDLTWTCSQFMVTLATFTTFVLVDEHNVLDARTAFVSLALLNVMATPLTAFPMVIIFAVQAAVSIKRLSKFLNADEIDFGAVSHDSSEGDPIVLENGSFTWDDPENNVLEDVNVRIKKGSLVAVVGIVGSGKSSLLSAILGETEITSGRVNTIGNVSYASQIPWIQNATLRENILFGKAYKPIKYNRVIEACCLNPDLDVLAGRDKIEIGEKGINLSGGQKQRVSVARAVYNKANIYLFDDPLSAVDAHVGKAMFDNVFGPKGLLRKKTRVLVTHSVTFLPQADQIIVLKNGRISEIGTYQELLDRQGEFSEFVAQYSNSESKDSKSDDLEIEPGHRRASRLASITSECSGNSTEYDMAPGSPLLMSKDVPEAQKLIGEEFKETTSVPWRLYVHYFKAAGWVGMLLSVSAFALYQVFAVTANSWLSIWSETEIVNGTQANQEYNIGVYAALGISQSIMYFTATILMSLAVIRSASTYHSKMLFSILRAPMWFFDTTPTGRILNRFAKDVDVLDNTLSVLLRNWLAMSSSVVGTFAIIVYNLPMFAVVIIPLCVFYYIVQKFYIPTSRQVKRLESVTRSPIYSNFSETINGASTIRAYGQRDRFLLDAQAKIDENQICYFPSVVSNRWLAVRLESMGSLVVFFTAVFAVVSRETITPGSVGLSISYALNVTALLSYLVRMFCDVESNIVAVERLKEYCEAPQEAPWKSPTITPSTAWPEEGLVQFNNYQARYREGLDLVLKNVSFEIQPGEKIGVVGRTGAGKSSLTLALFRLVEGAGGSITIDGENIGRLGLHDLREKLTIIPQDPVLFSGTLRFNLDPFEKSSDHDIWKALELAHLSKFVESLPAKLDYKVSEGGENLSVGQKQLVCLARALLRKSKILVLDEATAAVDLETDDLIQETIRAEFQESTVITIAHRINTIMDSTRILVLDNGFIREYATPSQLMEDTNSHFYQMARDAGLVSS